MSTTSPGGGEMTSESRHGARYVGVIIVEVLVLAGIWLFQRYFG